MPERRHEPSPERTMTLGSLLAALRGLTEIQCPGFNATPCDEVVVRIDLGPDQDFEVRSVYVEDRSGYDEDSIVVIEAGLHWSPPPVEANLSWSPEDTGQG
jgi:hypothetical protein